MEQLIAKMARSNFIERLKWSEDKSESILGPGFYNIIFHDWHYIKNVTHNSLAKDLQQYGIDVQRPLAQGPQTGESDVEQQYVGGGRHAETGRAEPQSHSHQHRSGPIMVGESAHDGHQAGAQSSAGHVQHGYTGSGQPGVLDDGVDEYREYVRLARPTAEDHQARCADDEPTVKDAAAGLRRIFRWVRYCFHLVKTVSLGLYQTYGHGMPCPYV